MNTSESATGFRVDDAEHVSLETVDVLTGSDPSASVIWLHGLGADGHDFEPLVPQLLWPGAPAIRFVFPHAPVRPVTINGGMAMRAWYDIISLASDRNQDLAGISESINRAATLIERERRRGIDSERIVLAGFSQGGAIAVQLALRYREKLAGLVALSSYLLLEQRLESDVHPANRDLPVFVGHGSNDPMVPVQLGEMLAGRLRDMDHPVEWHSYPMPHAVCPEEITDLSAWFQSLLD